MELSSESKITQQKTSFYAPLFKVTAISKYFALVLFVALPFIGGWMGYSLSANKAEINATTVTPVVTVNKPIPKPLFLARDSQIYLGDSKLFKYNSHRKSETEPTYILTKESLHEQLLALNLVQPEIHEHYLSALQNGFHLKVTKLTGSQSLVSMRAENAEIISFIYDEWSDEIIKKSPWKSPDYLSGAGPIRWTQLDGQAHLIAITCAAARNCTPEIILYDYINATSTILYIEIRQDVRLADACELGCTGGLLDETSSGDLLVGAYYERDSIFSNYFETLIVPLPETFKKERESSISNYQ